MMGRQTGQVEHYVVSAVSKFIPESVRTRWNEYRQSLKDEEEQHLGDNEISDKVEMVGWGVEKAQERNKEEASEFERPPFLQYLYCIGNALHDSTSCWGRMLLRASLRRAQYGMI